MTHEEFELSILLLGFRVARANPRRISWEYNGVRYCEYFFKTGNYRFYNQYDTGNYLGATKSPKEALSRLTKQLEHICPMKS